MRHLATIQRVNGITPIDGADKIELAHILGWQCVVKKEEFREGDLCVYFEIDSFLPIRPEFEFLRSSSYKNTVNLGEGFRLKTQKFRGEISQGLALPISMFTELSEVHEGDDVTEILGVKKFEIEESVTSGGTAIAQISSVGVPHTDETRIQAMPELLERFRNIPYYITTKMDGSSHSCAITEDGKFHVTGHNFEYKDDGKSGMYELAKKLNVESGMRLYMKEHNLKSMVIQGELCAPKIQKNKLQLKEPHWYIFTVLENGERVDLYETCKVCWELNLEMVPLEERGEDLCSRYWNVDMLLERAGENRCGVYPGTPEGIVIRPVVPVYCDLLDGPLSMKVINNQYLLKAKD